MMETIVSTNLPGPPRAALVASAVQSAARLRDWLLTGPAQVSGDDAEHGGIAGTIDSDGRPRYVYAEITGYYLAWLADVALADTNAVVADQVRLRARLALDWSERSFGRQGRLPQTRVYLEPAAADWRNDAVFFFDFAMLLHGIDAATQAGIVADAPALRSEMHAHISAFVSGERLRCVIQVRGARSLPARWSTQGGPFLVKASSRVAHSHSQAPLPNALALACARDIEQWSELADAINPGMLHPTLYFAEGLLLARPERADAIAALLQRCLALTHADGSLPEAADGTARVRNDVLAQALRVGILLRDLSARDAPADAQLDALARTLVERIGDRAFLVFNADSPKQANVWCTMFAEQALRWYVGARLGHYRRPSAGALV